MILAKNKIILGIFNNVALFLPIFLGLVHKNIRWAVFGAFGALVYNYYVPQEHHRGLVNLLIMSTLAFVGFSLALIINSIPWITPLFICFLGGITFFFDKTWNIIGPGPFFIMMVSSMGGTQTFQGFLQTETVSAYLFSGIVIAVIAALLAELLLQITHATFISEQSKYATRFNDNFFFDIILLLSISYAIAIFLAFYIGKNLHLFNYYWVVVACSAVLKAENFTHAIKRHRQYILGAVVGCALAFIFISLPMTLAENLVIILFLNTLIYWQINKNYLIGNFFTTPLALLLFKLIIPRLTGTALFDRLISVIIGTTLGLLISYATEKILQHAFPKQMTKYHSNG